MKVNSLVQQTLERSSKSVLIESKLTLLRCFFFSLTGVDTGGPGLTVSGWKEAA